MSSKQWVAWATCLGLSMVWMLVINNAAAGCVFLAAGIVIQALAERERS